MPPARPPISAREIVNGLDRREIILGSAATIFAVGLAIIGYHYGTKSSNATLRANASTFLVAMLVGAFMLGLGTLLRRRAIVGFAAFFFGMEQISLGSEYFGVLFLGFGGWLIYRVMQKSKVDRGQRVRTRQVETKVKGYSQSAKASKRYTPPKHNRSARSR